MFTISVGDGERAQLFVDEDMDRTNDDKTAAVHFLRFEFSDSAAQQYQNWGWFCRRYKTFRNTKPSCVFQAVLPSIHLWEILSDKKA